MLDGCIDADLTATPFTNTLPIRRLEWQCGVPIDLKVAYITLPSLHLSVERQRYTCLVDTSAERRFRFESIGSDFTAEIQVDSDGLVIDYPGLYRRVWAR